MNVTKDWLERYEYQVTITLRRGTLDCGRRDRRQQDMEGGTFTHLAFDGYGTVHSLNHMAHDRET